MNLNFKPLPYAIKYFKSDKKKSLEYYIDNLGVTERFDWFNTQDIFCYLASNGRAFEEHFALILKLLVKKDKTQGSAYIINGIDIRKEFCVHAATVLEFMNPTKEFLYALPYKYVINPYCDFRFLNIFFYYDGPNKEEVYKGLIDGITIGLKLDLLNTDKNDRKGAAVREIFRRVIGTISNGEDMPLELYRILKELKKAGPIINYERFATPKPYIKRTEEQELFLARYRFGVLSRAFDSLSKDNSDTKEKIVKALKITKNDKAHFEQTAWLARKLSNTMSRNDYLLYRGLMNESDAPPFIQQYITKKGARFRSFAKAYEGDTKAIRRLTQNELFLLFPRLPKEKKAEVKNKAKTVFDKCIHYKDGKKELSALFDIMAESEEMGSEYAQNKKLYERSLSLASLRKKYLEKIVPGAINATRKTCKILNHVFVKLWDGCVSVWHDAENSIKGGVSQTKQFIMSLIKDCGLILETINRDSEGKITRYSAMTINGSSASRPTFKTVNKHRADFYYAAFVNVLKANKETFNKLKEFDDVFKLIYAV